MPIGRYRDAKALPPAKIRGRFADDVRQARHNSGLSQEAFAKECGIPLRTYKRFEAGSCDSLLVFIKVLKVHGRFDAFELLFPEPAPFVRLRTPLAAAGRLETTVEERKKSRKSKG